MFVLKDTINNIQQPSELFQFVLIDSLFVISFILLVIFRKKIFVGEQDVLEINNSIKIKGLLSVLIIVHHLSQIITHTILLKVFALLGIVCVAVFFFYSGYGLMKNYLTKPDYLKGFFKKRVLKILLPYTVCITVTWLLYFALGHKLTIRDMLESYALGEPFVRYTWYVVVILILYVLFYISAKIGRSPKRIMLIVALGIALYINFVETKYSWANWTINSCFSFLAGMFIAAYPSLTEKLLKPSKKSAVIFAVMYLISGSMVFYTLLGGVFTLEDLLRAPEFADFLMRKPLAIIGMNVISILNVFTTLFIFSKIHLSDKIFIFLGKISFHIYIYHGLVMKLLRNSFISIQSDFLYSVLVIIMSVIAAYLFTKLDNLLYSLAIKIKPVKTA